MQKRTTGIILFALFLFVWGLFWLVAVYKRCEAISRPKQPKVEIAQKQTTEPAPPEEEQDVFIFKFRSPHAKWYHWTFFWVIASLELGMGFLFMFAGTAIIRLYRKGRVWVFTALAGDAIFKFAVCMYMFFCAIPLARLTGSQNSLGAYFLPDKTFFSSASGYLSGIRMYPPFGNLLGAILYIVVLAGCFYYFNRKDIREKFSPASK